MKGKRERERETVIDSGVNSNFSNFGNNEMCASVILSARPLWHGRLGQHLSAGDEDAGAEWQLCITICQKTLEGHSLIF